MRERLKVAAFVAGFTWIAVVLPALGQDVPACKNGNFELGLFGGESYGLDRFRPMGGGNIAYGLSCALFPFAEGSYLPGILRTINVPTGSTNSSQQFNVNMTDFHAGLHIRVPRPESRVIPYAVVGLGLIRGSKSTGTVYNVSNFGTVPFTQTIPSSVNFAFDFGGGLRFFFNERFAVRLEFKGFKPTSAPTPLEPKVFYRFAIGPVFQLR
jgi:hypothetical protein